ncbi:MAG: neutral/alkaline non-lysosomal ceramidase N-terminal domain-containing protein [Candidatus Lokiarchaeota archaeon]|nr:neutral/alkaline non-lysosomal ceramidase N-terminal domain-containing protein [Candidatus Lokiarchaeota archaeon]
MVMLRVSFGRVSVTPDDLTGVSLAGFYRRHRAQGVLDTLYARGIMVEDTILGNVKKRVLLISVDTMKVPLSFTNYIKEKIFDAYKVPPGAILIHPIHTHAGIDLTGEYHWPGGLGNTVRSIMFGMGYNDRMLVWMARQIVKMVGELVEHLEPARIAWGRSVIGDRVIVNRRHWTRPYHADLGVICFKNATTGKMIGAIVNYGAHPTILSNKNHKLSAEWPGRLVERLEEVGGFKAAFFNDAAGDVSPSFREFRMIFKKLRAARGRFRIAPDVRIKAMEGYGWMIADRALALVQSIPDEHYCDNIESKCYTRTVWFPIEDFKGRYNALVRIQNRFWHLSKKYILLPIVFATTSGKEPNFPGLALKHRGLIDVQCYTKIQYFQFRARDSRSGAERAFNIIGLPGEPLRHFGRSLQRKTKEGFDDSFLFQMSNDWMAYLLDYSEYTYGGGEPMESLAPVAGKYLKRHFVQLLADVDAGLTTGHS